MTGVLAGTVLAAIADSRAEGSEEIQFQVMRGAGRFNAGYLEFNGTATWDGTGRYTVKGTLLAHCVNLATRTTA
ncbi:hypothetical protein ACFQ7A_01580 [Streptomyces sp. NPDC056528]|uniref:hypothetical protein n=1 Tax=Streptomyces sp. NPDC056528 TaxID=3345854 RepID=UPI00369D2285